MKRRDFLRSTGFFSASLAFAKPGRIFARDTTLDATHGPTNDLWRTFEVTTRAEVLKPSGATRIWVPAPLISESPFQKTLSATFQPEGGGTAKLVQSNADSLGIISAEYPSDVKPVLTCATRITTKNYVVDLSARGNPPKIDRADLQHFSADQASANRWHRENHGDRNHQRRENGRRKSPRHLRMDR